MKSGLLTHNAQMDTATFNKFRQIVYETSGISLNANKESLVKARIAKRMRFLNIKEYEDYLEKVVKDQTGLEIQVLLDAISTNTTHFYREADHFEFLRGLIKECLDKNHRKIRIWSAASSTGEEPYTLAMEVSEALGGVRCDAKILATDINTTVLTTAIRGDYTEDKVTPIPKMLLSRYFDNRVINGIKVFSAKDELRRMLIFRQFNLTNIPFPIRPDLDIIMCRNVMIYFDQDLRARLANEFSRILKPGGYLFIGHAESLTGMDAKLKCIRPSIYKKE